MAVKSYNKLVRDKIPDIIAELGKTCVCETLSDEAYLIKLNEKLQEEVSEYLESGTIEELVDIGEVIHAILAYQNVSVEEYQRMRIDKRKARGGFEKRILLKEVIED